MYTGRTACTGVRDCLYFVVLPIDPCVYTCGSVYIMYRRKTGVQNTCSVVAHNRSYERTLEN
jgi:hypothetical protein